MIVSQSRSFCSVFVLLELLLFTMLIVHFNFTLFVINKQDDVKKLAGAMFQEAAGKE